MKRAQSTHRRATAMLLAALAIAMLGSVDLAAQRFQWVYGGATCREAGRGGVKQLAGGGYIAVGESYTTTAGCTNSHIYVVVTNTTGTVVWSNTYNIGLNDSATDVVELSPAGTGYAICGVTKSSSSCGTSRDAFIMTINTIGAVTNARVYGSPTTDEIAWGICQANFGTPPANPGDLIIAGSTTFSGGGSRNGYIVRVDPNTLNIIWDRWYGATTSTDDYLYDVIESQVGTGAGDIVAVGGTTSWGSGARDAWMIRVSGQNGQTGISTIQNVAAYGGTADDEARAVVEIQTNGTPGDLVMAGNTFSRPAPSANSEVLLIRTGPNPCTFLAGRYSGDNNTGADGGMDVKEDAFSTTGIIVTGYTAFSSGTIVAPNVFLNRFTVGTLAPAGAGMMYGGTGDDKGWSVNVAQNSNANETQGYVVAGYTKSSNLIPATDPEQLYLIKTDLNLSSLCNMAGFAFNSVSKTFTPACPIPAIAPVGPSCTPTVLTIVQNWGNQLCYTNPSNHEQGNGGNDGVSGVESPAVISFNEGTVASYPNPITSGMPLNLRFDLASSADVQISVSDLVGREIYRATVEAEAGSALRTIDTKGWTSGTYLVRVGVGAKSATMRVVVLDR